MVDGDRVEGAAKNVGGKLQDAVGGLTGDTETEARGQVNQAVGAIQNAYGAAKDTAREWGGSVAETTKDRPLTALLVALSIGYVIHLLTRTRRS